MNLFYDHLSMNQMLRPARLLRPMLFLMVLIFIAGATSSLLAQPSTAEVCRETKKVAEQLEREITELVAIRLLIRIEPELREALSLLNRGIANGRIELSGRAITFLANLFKLEQPGATAKDRMAFQKTVRPLVQKALQEGANNKMAEVESRIEQLEEQLTLRNRRMRANNCDRVSTSGSSAGEMELLGCYKDSNKPFDLDGFLERSSTNTPESCVAKCRDKGFAFAGVQYGQSCLCGNSYGKQGKSSDCNMKCTGDASKICGGLYCNNVYGTGVVPK